MNFSKIYLASAIAMALAVVSCNDFIDVPPTGVVDMETAMSQPEKW